MITLCLVSDKSREVKKKKKTKKLNISYGECPNEYKIEDEQMFADGRKRKEKRTAIPFCNIEKKNKIYCLLGF